MLEVTVERVAGVTICRPMGELDAFSVGRLRERLSEIEAAARVVIDLSETPFLDSAGIGGLLGGIRRVREHGGEVAVACDRPNVSRLLHTAGFDRIVPLTESVDAAIGTFTADA